MNSFRTVWPPEQLCLFPRVLNLICSLGFFTNTVFQYETSIANNTGLYTNTQLYHILHLVKTAMLFYYLFDQI